MPGESETIPQLLGRLNAGNVNTIGWPSGEERPCEDSTSTRRVGRRRSAQGCCCAGQGGYRCRIYFRRRSENVATPARAEESAAATFEGVAAEATTDARWLSRRNEKHAAVTPDTALEDVA